MSQQPQQPTEEQQDAAKTPETTQEQLTHDRGDGIRGGYGNSDQTNGLEGGQDAPAKDASPAKPSSEQ